MSAQDNKPSFQPGQQDREIHQFNVEPTKPAQSTTEPIRQREFVPSEPARAQQDEQPGKHEIHSSTPARARDGRIRPNDVGPRQHQNSKQDDCTDRVVMSADEVERIINYVEQEYGTQVSSEVRKVVREEISSAVPELTRVLLPLFTADKGENVPNSEELQQECVKAFLHVMVPHMQKIMRSVQ